MHGELIVIAEKSEKHNKKKEKDLCDVVSAMLSFPFQQWDKLRYFVLSRF